MSNVESLWPAWRIAICYGIAFLIAASPLFLFGQGWTGEVVILLEHLLRNQHDTPRYLASAYLDPEYAMGTDPTRILHALPIALALWTPWPDRVLDAALFITWVGLGMSVWKLALLLFPGNRIGAGIAGMITVLTAFDVSELHVSYYPHLLSVLLFVLALILLIRWWLNGGLYLLALSCIMLGSSMLIFGLASPSIPFAIILLITLSVVNQKPLHSELRRLLLPTITWGAPLAIYAAVLFGHASSFPSESSTARAVSFHFSWEQVLFWGRMVLLNFNPFAWFDAHRFFWIQTVNYSDWVVAMSAAGAAMWGSFTVAVMDDSHRAASPQLIERRRFLLLGAALLAMIAVSNISFSNLMMADSMFRTHLVSQIPAAVLMGVALSALWSSNSKTYRLVGLTLTVLIFFCGAWSVAARSRHLVSTWKAHHMELASLAEHVKRIPESVDIILFNPPGTPFTATVASWHARGWIGILRGRVQSREHFFLWSPDRGANCTSDGEKLACSGESQSHVEFDVRNLVILDYNPVDGKYHVMEGGPPLSARYTPIKQLLDSPVSLPTLARKIIGG